MTDIYCERCGNNLEEDGFDVVRTLTMILPIAQTDTDRREISVLSKDSQEKLTVELRCCRCDEVRGFPADWSVWVCGHIPGKKGVAS